MAPSVAVVEATAVSQTTSELVTLIGNKGPIHLKSDPSNVMAFGTYPDSEWSSNKVNDNDNNRGY